MAEKTPIWRMIKEAVEALGGRATNSEIRHWVHSRYGDVNNNTISTMINAYAVNAPGRVGMPENSKPRIANTRHDFLYRTDRGTVELYDPERHGLWAIARDENGKLTVRRAEDGESASRTLAEDIDAVADRDEDTNEFLFPLERHLRDFLVANIHQIKLDGSNLSVYNDDHGQTGVEYPTGVGFIDVLAVDADGNFAVFELKLGRGPDAAVGQLARYMGWVKRNLAGDRYAASVIPDVKLFEYAMTFALRSADEPRT